MGGLRSDIENPVQVSESRMTTHGNESKVTRTEQKPSQSLRMAYAHMAMHKPICPEMGKIYQFGQLNCFCVFSQILNHVSVFPSTRENQAKKHAKNWAVQDDASDLLVLLVLI